jgi:hypothetical protein
MTAPVTPELRRGVLRRRAQAAVALLRREPQPDRLRLLSCVVARGEEMLRRRQRARVEAEPAT